MNSNDIAEIDNIRENVKNWPWDVETTFRKEQHTFGHQHTKNEHDRITKLEESNMSYFTSSGRKRELLSILKPILLSILVELPSKDHENYRPALLELMVHLYIVCSLLPPIGCHNGDDDLIRHAIRVRYKLHDGEKVAELTNDNVPLYIRGKCADGSKFFSWPMFKGNTVQRIHDVANQLDSPVKEVFEKATPIIDSCLILCRLVWPRLANTSIPFNLRVNGKQLFSQLVNRTDALEMKAYLVLKLFLGLRSKEIASLAIKDLRISYDSKKHRIGAVYVMLRDSKNLIIGQPTVFSIPARPDDAHIISENFELCPQTFILEYLISRYRNQNNIENPLFPCLHPEDSSEFKKFLEHNEGQFAKRKGDLIVKLGTVGQRSLTTHSIRHGMVSLLIELGYPKDLIKELGRWRSESSFQMYWDGAWEQHLNFRPFNQKKEGYFIRSLELNKISSEIVFATPVHFKNYTFMNESVSALKKIDEFEYSAITVNILVQLQTDNDLNIHTENQPTISMRLKARIGVAILEALQEDKDMTFTIYNQLQAELFNGPILDLTFLDLIFKDE
jgi:integrase